MFVVITFRTGPGRSDFTFHRNGAGIWFDPKLLREWVWEDPSTQEAWIHMWRYTADRLKNHPVVVGYDLMCEPHPEGDVFLDDQLDLFEARGLNHAIWMRDPAWKPWTEVVNSMNFRFGQDFCSQEEEIPNPLTNLLEEYWSLSLSCFLGNLVPYPDGNSPETS